MLAKRRATAKRPNPARWPVLVAVVTGLAAAALPVSAARDGRGGPELDRGIQVDDGSLVRKVQERLRALGYYAGAVDGRPGAALTEAIIKFQRRIGLEPDGAVTPALLETLSTQSEVRRLEQQLRTGKESEIAAARQALTASGILAAIRAEPLPRPGGQEQAAPCLASPTPACLLVIARDQARRIERPELREWALSDVIAAQARANLIEDARRTMAALDDPRTLLLALRAVAEGHADAGRFQAASQAAAAIPLAITRAEARGTIAAALAERGDRAGALALIAAAAADLAGLPVPDDRVLVRLAVTAAHSGARDHALALFERATDPDASPERRITLAVAMADADEPDLALAAAEPVRDQSQRDALLVALASALARKADFGAARMRAEEIRPERYRAVALAAVAAEAARTGRLPEAASLLARAREAAAKIGIPYARAFAEGRIAQAMAAAGDVDAAIDLASAIKDDAIRAHTLWAVALTQPADSPPARRGRTLAAESLRKVLDPVTRTRALASYAADLAAAGDRSGVTEAIADAIAVAKSLTDPWSRARTLMAVADAMVKTAR